MHTIYRFIRASLSFLVVAGVFAAWGLIAALASGDFAPMIAATLFAVLFFAPAAFYNTWEDVGD